MIKTSHLTPKTATGVRPVGCLPQCREEDVVVYGDLKIQNMVKNHDLAKSISDAGWYQFTQWLEYFGTIWDKTVISVNLHFTSADCSNCGYRVKKSLSTRTHKCPRCHLEICRDPNAALNILKRGLEVLGVEYNSTLGHRKLPLIRKRAGVSSTAVDQGKPNSRSCLIEP
uniref:Cas12f1-like TNB domain-containing protein n=1 Tax=Moorena producens (strain JHB) TaxID=1454205 RepID=A0A1D9G7G6_MOOP1